MQRSVRGRAHSISPIGARPRPGRVPARRPVMPFLWKEFEQAPEQHRITFANRLAVLVDGLREELAIHETAAARKAELDEILSHLQMKYETVYEQYTTEQAIAHFADEIEDLFGVDISSRMQHVSGIGLPPAAEAHVAVAVSEWQKKVDETPWANEVARALHEQQQLLARKEQLRASIEANRKQLEAVERMKTEDALAHCTTRDEAETLLDYELSQAAVKDDDDDFKSELSTPPVTPVPSVKEEIEENSMDSDPEEDIDDFLDLIF